MSEERIVTDTNCDDRRKPLEKDLKSLEVKYERLSKKLDWFYIIAIATLIGVIIDVAKGW